MSAFSMLSGKTESVEHSVWQEECWEPGMRRTALRPRHGSSECERKFCGCNGKTSFLFDFQPTGAA
jgi:hypothetical protein